MTLFKLRKKYKRLIKEMSIKKPEDAIIKMETNTFKVVTTELQGDVNDYIKKLGTGRIIPKSVNHPKPEQPRIKSIVQLRDDIANGKVVRVKVNGGFIWKRIK